MLCPCDFALRWLFFGERGMTVMVFSDLALSMLLWALQCVLNTVGEAGGGSEERVEYVSVCETTESRLRSWIKI